MLQGRGLVVEHDRGFIGTLQDEVDGPIALTFASSLKQALQLLHTDAAHISIVFVSTSVPPKNGLEIVREIQALRPSLPIILMDHYDYPRVGPEQAEGMGCLALVLKPKNVHDMIKPLLSRLAAQNSWNDVAPTTDKKDVTLDVSEQEYLAVPMSDFVFSPKSFFNIYIRLSQGKFVKVLNAGDLVEPIFIAKYIEKGVLTLYIREEEHQRYINLCDKLLEESLRKSSVPLDEKTGKVLHLGENVKQSLYQSGLTAERLHFADNFLQHSAQLAKVMKREETKISDMIDGLLNRDHVTVVVMLAGLLAQHLGFESKKAVQMVGMSALFHDIGLYDLLPDLTHESPEELSPEQKKLWDKHPERGVEILRAMGGFDEIVYQSVSQHHLRKRGDVGRKTARQITMVSELIGVADDFQNLVLTGEYKEENMQKFMKEKLPLFSPVVAEAFEKILKGTK